MKIQEILIEPSKVYTDSNFIIKVKAIRYLTWNEVASKSFNEIANFTYDQIKGD